MSFALRFLVSSRDCTFILHFPSLFIPRTAVWALAAGGYAALAHAADEVRGAVHVVLPAGPVPVGGQEQVAEVEGYGDGEDKVEHDADACQRGHVGYGVAQVGLATYFVDHGHGGYHHEPHRGDEESHDEGKVRLEGVERGVEIIFNPRAWHKALDAAVEGRAARHRQAEQCGIEARNVAQMHHAQVLVAGPLHQPAHNGQTEEGKEVEAAAVGEVVDELRDGVVGHHAVEQFALAHPALRPLVACHLHPYRVHRVARHEEHACHHEWVAVVDGDAVGQSELVVTAQCERRLRGEAQAVDGLEVVARPVEVRLHKILRVDGGLALPRPVVGVAWVRIVAARQEQRGEAEEQKEGRTA